VSKRAYDELLTFNRALYEDCRWRTGPLADRLDSVSVAHDVDAVRAALGEKRSPSTGSPTAH
jgi:hypothetical protein